MEFLLAAITLGFLGSFHCIGMCGPIALALPIGSSKGISKVLLILNYNTGRIITYSIIGLFFGIIGQGFVIAGFQQAVSIITGLLILLAVLLPFGLKTKTQINGKVYSFFNFIKKELGKSFLKNGSHSLFLIGILNGLLPCGLVYMAVAGAIATGDPFKGALFMSVFGLGTLPMMLLLPFAGNFISLPFRSKIRSAMPVVLSVMAVLLILRGLNLGIPYVSPKMKTLETTSCHQSSDLSNHQNTIQCIGPNSQARR